MNIGIDLGSSLIKVALPNQTKMFPSALTLGGLQSTIEYQNRLYKPEGNPSLREKAILALLAIKEARDANLTINSIGDKTIWQELLVGHHHIKCDGQEYSITVHQVTQLEPSYGTFLDFALDENGEKRIDLKPTVILDCGHTGICSLEIHEGKVIAQNHHSWAPIYCAIAKQIKLETGIEIEHDQIKEELRIQKMSEQFKAAVQSEKILLQRFLPSPTIITGGNGEAIHSIFPNAIVLPITSCATGYFKISQRTARKLPQV